jgi:6,7-dimethyl-8-ribityllumazine synthase
VTALRTREGDRLARDLRIALVAARFNELVVDRLIAGATDALIRHGASDKNLELVRVPGCFDLPLAAQRLALSRRYDGLIALGAVIQGETAHFEYVAGQCAAGISQAALESGVPIAFGVLTCANLEQALDRAGGKAGNKGADAALAVLEMANLLKRLGD